MSRVIQDSDDDFEDEEEDIDERIEAPIDAAAKRDASVLLPHPGEHGTESTESLKKAFETAHRAHFQSQFSPSLPSPPQNGLDDDGLMSHRGNKRRKTSPDEMPKASGPTLGPLTTDPLNTFGDFKSVFSSPFVQQEHEVARQEVSGGKAWELQGTIREDYVQHEPMAMFSEPSSTIPNTTLTQQRLLEEVMAPAFLGLEPEVEPDQPRYEPQASVPWSDFLKTPSENTPLHSDPTNPPEQSSTKANLETKAPSNKSQPIDPPDILALSQGKSQCRPLSAQLRENPVGNEIDIASLPGATKEVLEQDIGARLHNPPRESKEPTEKKPVPSPSTRSKRKSSPVPTSDGYLESIGLPKEEYKPRPSRSRSARTAPVEPIDDSIIPEKLATRRGARRSKTSATEVAITPRRIQKICDMGFTPNTTQKALEKNNGDITQTVDWLVSNIAINDDRDELAPPSPIKTKPRNPKTSQKGSVEEQVEDCSTDMQRDVSALDEADDTRISENTDPNIKPLSKTAGPLQQKSPRVQVVVSKAGRNAQVSAEVLLVDPMSTPSNLKPKRRKTTLDQPESIPKEITLQAANAKRQGRGRPKMEPVVALSTMTVSNDSQEGGTEVKEGKQNATEETVFQELPPNAAPPRSIEPSLPTPPAKIPQITDEAHKARTTDGVQAGRSAGKVAYRVGLSKRTRIAPLLKIMKK